MNTLVPQHVAIIMDGNGRWAQRQGLPRIKGHEVGVERVEEIMRVAPDLGVKYLTLYAFSKENWQRPKPEVSFLMSLLSDYLDRKLQELLENNVIFNAIGRLQDLPEKVQEKITRNIERTKNNTGLVTTFCFSYSSRLEITDAVKEIAERVAGGKLKAADISEKTISDHLYTRGMPDPDLLIRTSGEMRLSNFLLWQLSYAEIYITKKYWPDFHGEDLRKAVREYQKRERRFGDIHA